MNNSNDILAIIPARGGSKRIPGKNIVDFCGKPMISRTIEAAHKARCFSQVIVSTDCKDIAEVAIEHGATVPFMREAHADDYSTASEATHWSVEKYIEITGHSPDYVVQMMANVPLKRNETISKFVNTLQLRRDQSLISCFEPKFCPPHWAVARKEDGTGYFPFNEYMGKRSQDLPELLIPTGAVWGASLEYLFEHRDFYGPSFRIFEIDWMEALDIDTPDELEICRALAGSIQ